jgi:hypothetical protein
LVAVVFRYFVIEARKDGMRVFYVCTLGIERRYVILGFEWPALFLETQN